jgi:RNA polymerase sigma-70 factor (ECF subfamily)
MRDAIYRELAEEFGASLERFASGWERDPDRRRDLVQEIHVALWRSLERWNGACSRRTWVYRVAHNVAVTHVVRSRRNLLRSAVRIDELEVVGGPDPGEALDAKRARARLLAMIQRLTPLDREVVLLYLEGIDAAGIAEVTGLSASNVATKIFRLKRALGGEQGTGRRAG